MKPTLVTIFISALCVNVVGQNLKSGGKLKPEQALMDIRHYTIDINVDIEQQRIDGTAEIDLITSRTTSVLLFDLVHLMKVDRVWVNGRKEAIEHKDDLVYINLKSPLKAGRAKVKFQYGGKPGIAERPPWEGGFTWTSDEAGNPWVAVTCWGEGANIYFPCKDHPSDEPNEGATLIVTVPENLYVAGPGLLKRNKVSKGKRTFTWETNYTINNYSIVFNIGRYKVATRTYTTVDGNKVPMQVYLLEQDFDKAEELLDIFEKSVGCHEKYFGEYPWVKEKMAVCQTPHLGMEHQSLNAYGNKFNFSMIADTRFDWLLHHEFGHEWWANKVTNIDWADMWIQEGICTFGDALFRLEYAGERMYLQHMQQVAINIQNKLPVVMGKDLDVDTIYHSDIYGKGAFFMHTLKFVIGDEKFFPILKKLATDPAYTYDNLVCTEDVEKLFSKESGQDLKPLFDLFLRTTEKLEIHVSLTKVDEYELKLLNLSRSLPLEVQTSDGVERIEIGPKPVTFRTKEQPIIDPNVYYFKKVIVE